MFRHVCEHVRHRAVSAGAEGNDRRSFHSEGCRLYKAIHCVFIGGCAVSAASHVKKINDVFWRDLGMPEAEWVLEVEEFGPLIVSIDAYGKNYFEEKKVEYNQKKDEQIALISAQVGFIK